MKEAFAYIDPGNGFVFIQNTSFIGPAILSLLGFILLWIRFFYKFTKRLLWAVIIIVIIIIIGGIIMSKRGVNKKVIIIGIDAMDPNITERLMNEGKLPNFSRLKSNGSYSRLQTTYPAESVVAWSSFSTGLNPGGHGVFDFIMREPSNYMPYLSLNEVSMDAQKIKIYRKGITFWETLSKSKIPSSIFFCPNTFPPEKILGKMLSGMGVPDLYGTMGRFLFYTSKELSEQEKETRGKLIFVKPNKNIVETYIYGPKVLVKNEVVESMVPLKITLYPNAKNVEIEFQDNRLFLEKDTWSKWQRISFKIGQLKKAYGIVKFYLKGIEPDFELYLSPVNFDPEKPIFTISFPKGLSRKIARKVGLYYTQGMPHDSWALSEDRIDEEAFLQHVDMVFEERERILREELKSFRSGVFFFYFDTLDIIQHMFWRFIDSKHPLFISSSPYKGTIFKYYEKMDQLLGEIIKSIDEDATIIVLSDHGFSAFRRTVHLNRWLLENGFLCLKDGITEGKEFFEGVDWSKTKAYALGFGGIYLNKIGREKNGIVEEWEQEGLKKAISEKLKQWLDVQAQDNIIKNVYEKEEIFTGPYTEQAPDLFIGFNAGYRASWQTALGGIPKISIEDNNKKWSGDHLVDPTLVPGIIFINKKFKLNNPEIADIAPTILCIFNIHNSKQTQGKILISDENH